MNLDPKDIELRKSLYLDVLINLIYNNMLEVIDEKLITFNNLQITLDSIKDNISIFEFLFDYSFEYITETTVYGVHYPDLGLYEINWNNLANDKFIEEMIKKDKFMIIPLSDEQILELADQVYYAEFNAFTNINFKDIQFVKNKILKFFSNLDTADF